MVPIPVPSVKLFLGSQEGLTLYPVVFPGEN